MNEKTSDKPVRHILALSGGVGIMDYVQEVHGNQADAARAQREGAK